MSKLRGKCRSSLRTLAQRLGSLPKVFDMLEDKFGTRVVSQLPEERLDDVLQFAKAELARANGRLGATAKGLGHAPRKIDAAAIYKSWNAKGCPAEIREVSDREDKKFQRKRG